MPSLNVNINTKTKLKKPIVSQSGELEPLNRKKTARYCQNNNWARAGIILKDKDIVLRRNRLHLIKMG